MFYFSKGGTYAPDHVDKDLFTASINRTNRVGVILHGDAIDVHGETEESANEIRQFILKTLRAAIIQ